MVRGVNFVIRSLVIVVATMASACTHTPSASGLAITGQESASLEEKARVPNEYLVTLAPDVGDGVISVYYARFGIKYLRALADETFLLVLSNDPGPRQMATLIRGDLRIKLIQPNIIYWDYR